MKSLPNPNQRRIPPERVACFRNRLCEWQMPESMIEYSKATMSEVGSERLFCQPDLQLLTEAWAAGHFANARKAKRVRLVDDVWPDFQLAFGDLVVQFELTEADLEGRRRGDEYRSVPNGTVTHDPVEDWIARAERIPAELERVSATKAGKLYPRSTPTGLLIYLNPGEYGIRHEKTVQTFVAATATAGEAFSEVWVYWKGKAYLTWRDGAQVAYRPERPS